MPDSAQTGNATLLHASELARTLALRTALNGIRYSSFGDSPIRPAELDRIVEAVPASLVPALNSTAFYFVPLALPPSSSQSGTEDHRPPPDRGADRTLISPVFDAALSEEAICHRAVQIPAAAASPAHEGIFISAALLRDQFSLAFEFFINVGHLFVGHAGIPEAFASLAWSQVLADVRGETSHDAWESRSLALRKPSSARTGPPPPPDEKHRNDFTETAFADALAIYQLSLAVDFDYSELREREYPLLAPSALAERLRLIARLFPPNPGYEFSIRYRRRT